MSVSCGNAHVSGAETTASTPAERNCLPTMSACFSPSTSTGVHTTSAGVPSGIRTFPAIESATISTMFTQRSREALSIRGSHVANTPNVTAFAPAFLPAASRFALATTVPFHQNRAHSILHESYPGVFVLASLLQRAFAFGGSVQRTVSATVKSCFPTYGLAAYIVTMLPSASWTDVGQPV